MSKKMGIFILMGLLVSLLLAGLLSPWASSSPDGLEKVAEDKGFMDKAEVQAAWTMAPIPDYAVSKVKSEAAAVGLAGLIGTLLVFATGMVAGRIMAAKKKAVGS